MTGAEQAQRPRRAGRRHRLRHGRPTRSSTAARERRPLRADRAGRARRDDRRAGPGAQRPAQLLRRGHPGRAAGALGAQPAAPRRPDRPGLRPDADPARAATAFADEGLPVYLYGSTEETLAKLIPALERMFPALKIAGVEPSKFRAVAAGRGRRDRRPDHASSGARLVLVGLGCPRQEVFTYAMRPLLDMPLMAVGAAFDYHAGLLRQPPPWMQRAGLEWLWRLGLEPKRLWRRYVHPQPGLPGPAGRAEDRPVEGHAAGRRPPNGPPPSPSDVRRRPPHSMVDGRRRRTDPYGTVRGRTGPARIRRRRSGKAGTWMAISPSCRRSPPSGWPPASWPTACPGWTAPARCAGVPDGCSPWR